MQPHYTRVNISLVDVALYTLPLVSMHQSSLSYIGSKFIYTSITIEAKPYVSLLDSRSYLLSINLNGCKYNGDAAK